MPNDIEKRDSEKEPDWSIFKDRIVTANQRDLEDPSLIAGCTTVSYSKFLRFCDFENGSITIRPQSLSPIYIIPNRYNLERVAAKFELPMSNFDLYYSGDEDSRRVIVNGVEYGADWALNELIIELKCHHHASKPWDLFDNIKKAKHLLSQMNLHDSQSINRFIQENPDEIKHTSIEYVLRRLQLRNHPLEAVGWLIEQSYKRGGVQIIFNNNEAFKNFVLNNTTEIVDDITLEIRDKIIPNNIIRGFVPLGEYEMSKMIST